MKYRYARYAPRYKNRYFGEVALGQLRRAGVELPLDTMCATGYRLDSDAGFVSTGSAPLSECVGAMYSEITPLYVCEFRPTAVVLPEDGGQGAMLGDVYLTARCRVEEVPYWLPEDYVDTVEAAYADYPVDGVYGGHYYVRGAPVGELYARVGGVWRIAEAYVRVNGAWKRVSKFVC